MEDLTKGLDAGLEGLSGTARFADRDLLFRVEAERSDRLLTAQKKAAGGVPDPGLLRSLSVFLPSTHRPVGGYGVMVLDLDKVKISS